MQLAQGFRLESPASTENQLYRFLERRRTVLDGVVISGGEPTIQKDLFSSCLKLKQMGYPVKLDKIEEWEKKFLPSKDVGTLIISTSKGVLSHKEVKEKNVGGRLLAFVY